jgi:hypothetical protein
MATAQVDAPRNRRVAAGIQYKIASTRREREDAFRLVYDAYLRTGLGEPNRHRIRVTPYQLLSSTDIFVALLRGEVISTVSLVGDSPTGLPMESIYRDVVASRRAQGMRLAEVTCLADRRRDFHRFLPVFLELSRILVHTARYRAIDELLVTVHPRHSGFYEKRLAFRQVGERKCYPSVCGRPAVALSLDFDLVDRERAKEYQALFGAPVPVKKLQPRPISQSDREYFLPMIDTGSHPLSIAPAGSAMPAARAGSPIVAA